jgi:ubiquitin C-terminal hydrolase
VHDSHSSNSRTNVLQANVPTNLSAAPLLLLPVRVFCSGRTPGHKNSPTYNPQSLLSAVCCHAPVFRGKQQHDSHELMRMLLDGLQVGMQQQQHTSREGNAMAWWCEEAQDEVGHKHS